MNQQKPTSFLDFMRQKHQPPGTAEADATGATPVAEPPRRVAVQQAPVNPSSPLPGIGARTRQEPVGLIVTVFLCLAIVAGLLGFVIGKRHGYDKGMEEGLGRKSSEELRAVDGALREPFATQATANPGKVAASASTGPDLPVEAKPLPRETVQNTTRATETASVTLQVQSLGRNQQEATRELVKALKIKGLDAFANYADGVVYVGRFSAVNTPEAKKAKSAVSEFQWRKRNFHSCYFVNTPKYTGTEE